MKALALTAIAAASLSLAACNTQTGYHDSIKLQAGGVNMNASTGFSAGYLGATVDRVLNVDKDGKPIVVAGGCKTDAVDTFANLNSKASASATSIAPAGAAVGSAINSPSIAWASGDVSANGGAAIIASAASTAHPADTIAAYCGNTLIPAANPGAIVRDGLAPK